MKFLAFVLLSAALTASCTLRAHLLDKNSSHNERYLQSNTERKFICPSDYKAFFCLRELDNIYFHGVFELSRPSSLALLVHQICRGIAICIPRRNFRIILHYDGRNKGQYDQATAFLNYYSVPYLQWKGPFDTYTVHLARLQVLNDVYSFSKYILQVDSDEFVPLAQLQQVIVKFSALQHVPGSCGVIMGTLQDRITRDGHLPNITLETDIASLFPMQCSIKKKLEQAAYRKIVLYNSVYRPWIGNHKLLCQGDSSVRACYKRVGMPSNMMPYYSSMRAPPQACKEELPIYHLKYIWGLKEYLTQRVQRFRSQRIRWYDESVNVLNHLSSHEGRICVDCEDFNCHEVEMKSISKLS